MTTQNELENLTRAPAGGIIGLNGLGYAGGEFLPMSARGGNRGAAARDEIAKREAAAKNQMELARKQRMEWVEAENRRRAILMPLIKEIVENAKAENWRGFWANTAQSLRVNFRGWADFDGTIEGSYLGGTCEAWQTGTLSPKWANRIARTDAEYEALISDA
jgi:hypothetical protein